MKFWMIRNKENGKYMRPRKKISDSEESPYIYPTKNSIRGKLRVERGNKGLRNEDGKRVTFDELYEILEYDISNIQPKIIEDI